MAFCRRRFVIASIPAGKVKSLMRFEILFGHNINKNVQMLLFTIFSPALQSCSLLVELLGYFRSQSTCSVIHLSQAYPSVMGCLHPQPLARLC